MVEQLLSKGVVEYFNDRLYLVNLRAPAPNVILCLIHDQSLLVATTAISKGEVQQL